MPPQEKWYGKAQDNSYQGQKCVTPTIAKTLIHDGNRKREQETSDRTSHSNGTDGRSRHTRETVYRVQVDNLQAVHNAERKNENPDIWQDPVKLGVCCPL